MDEVSCTTKDVSRSEKSVESSTWNNIVDNILDALENWAHRILDSESIFNWTATLNQKISDSLHRQLLDGFISDQDVRELEYVCDLWTKLLVSLNCRLSGCEFSNRNVLSYLLELYTLKQISKELFIETALQL